MNIQDNTVKQIINRVVKKVANDNLTRIANEMRARKIKATEVEKIIDTTFANFPKWFENEDTIVLPYIGRFTIKDGRKEFVNRNNEKSKTNGSED